MMQEKKMPEGLYVVPFGLLKKNAAGITRVLLRRTELFGMRGADIKILLTGREIDQLDVVSFYIHNGYPNIRKEQFLYWGEYIGGIMMDAAVLHRDETKHFCLENCCKEFSGNQILYYDQGELIAIETIQSIPEKRTIQYYNRNGTRECEETLWEGRLNRVYRYSSEEGIERKISLFYAANGFCFMRIVEEKRNVWDIKKIWLFSEKDKAVKTFAEWNEFRQYFYVSYINNCNAERVFCLCDEFMTFHNGLDKLLSISDKEIYRIGIIHFSGLAGECCWYSETHPLIAEQIEKKLTPDVDALCFLTRQAKECYQKRWGERNIFYHIANPIAVPDEIIEYNVRNKRRIVYIGRFKEIDKQVSHIIKAFEKVSVQIPDAELYMFGTGEDEAVYRGLIERLGLQKAHLMSFTNDASGEFQKSALAVVSSSNTEAFCLSLAEALANGTPVVSYDYKFGARDLIQNGKNGLIVEQNNIDALAEGITELLQAPKRLEAMSVAAREIIREIDENHFMEKWIDLLNDIVEKYSFRTMIRAVNFELESYAVDIKKQIISIRGIYTIEGQIPAQASGMEKFYFRVYNSDKSDYEVENAFVKRTGDRIFCISAEIPFTKNEVSICMKWNNSFAESFVNI